MKIKVKVMRESNVLGVRVGKEDGRFLCRKDLENGSIEKSYSKVKEVLKRFGKSNLVAKFDVAKSHNKTMKGRTFTLTLDKGVDFDQVGMSISCNLTYAIVKPSKWNSSKTESFSEKDLSVMVEALSLISGRMETQEESA